MNQINDMESREEIVKLAYFKYPDNENDRIEVQIENIGRRRGFLDGYEYSNNKNKSEVEEKNRSLEYLRSCYDLELLNKKQLLDEIERLKKVISGLENMNEAQACRLKTFLNTDTGTLLDEIDMLKFQLKAADSVNDGLSKQVEWISVEDRLPLANESGSWDGKRSDVYLGKYKDDTYCLFRIYEGFLDGSDFIEYYDENDNSINAPVYYKSIT